MIYDIAIVLLALVGLYLVFIIRQHIKALERRADSEEARADAAAGDLSFVRMQREDLYLCLRNEQRAGAVLEAKLRDEIERQHELRDEQTDRADGLRAIAVRSESFYAENQRMRRELEACARALAAHRMREAAVYQLLRCPSGRQTAAQLRGRVLALLTSTP